MKTWVPRYEQIAHLSPDEKLRFYQRGLRTMNAGLLAGVLSSPIMIALLTAFSLSADKLPQWFRLPLLFSPMAIGIYLTLTNEVFLNKATRRILMEKWHDTQALPALIEFANTQRGKGVYPFRNWGMDNLRLVLPLLQDDQYAMLSTREKRKLYALITVDAYPDFLMAAIETLGCFADVEALPTVRKVAEAAAFTPQQREVRQRAQECVAFLEARVQEKTLEQSLLRGSQANADTSHILLRAAEGQETSEAERHELLRANVQQ